MKSMIAILLLVVSTNVFASERCTKILYRIVEKSKQVQRVETAFLNSITPEGNSKDEIMYRESLEKFSEEVEVLQAELISTCLR